MQKNNNIITVKNTEDNSDTAAEIVIQNKIDYTPKVSVIIPVYNVEKYLRQCLDSVVNQTLKEIEIICVDDGSTDSSLEILKEYAQKDNRITVITKENKGLSNTRNVGIKIAKGIYISFIDSDDYINKEFYFELFETAIKTNSDVCAGNITRINTNSQEMYINYTEKKEALNLEDKFILCFVPKYNYVVNKIYLSSLIKDNNIYFPEGIYYEDMRWTPTLLLKSQKVTSAPNATYYYNYNNESIGATRKIGTQKQKDFIESTIWIDNFITSRNLQIPSVYNARIPIILSGDNNYAAQIYTTIYSVLKNSQKTTFYDFYILIPSNFKKTHIENIRQLQYNYHCQINFIDMKNAFSDITLKIQHITTPTFYRLLASDLLPNKYDKCIYLDADICVCKDLSEMYNIDMEDNYVAGVVAAGYYFKNNYNSNRLNIPNANTYINAGSIILNLKEIRKDKLTLKFIELSKNNYSSQDQDILNVACYGKIKLLPLKYNFMTKYLKNLKSDDFNNLYGSKNIQEAEKKPVIIHFADKIKPWQQIVTKYDEIWWKYAKETPYYKTFKSNLKVDKLSYLKSYLFFPYYLWKVKKLKNKLNKLSENTQESFSIPKQYFSKFTYYRYKVLSKILWGKKRKKYKQKYKELKKIKKSLKHR